MKEPQREILTRGRVAAAVVLLVIGAALCMVLLAPAGGGSGDDSDAAATVAPSPTAETDGMLVAGANADGEGAGASGGTGSTGSASAAGGSGGVAPLQVDEGTEAKDPPYSDKAISVDNPSTQFAEQVAKATAALAEATRTIHDCEAKLQERHERLKRPGRADPLLCVYDATAMNDEPGLVRMDIVTPNGYSFYVDVDGQRYRYSEYDGTGCRSIDDLAGCGAW